MNREEFDDQKINDDQMEVNEGNEIASNNEVTINTEETKDSYEVGYGRPPKKTRFRKGVSGNPTGRPKKLLDFDAALLREGRKLITVNKNGRSVRISKHDVVVSQVMLDAMKGTASDRRLYREAHRQALEKTAQLETGQTNELERFNNARELTEEELLWIASGGDPKELLKRRK
jgi:hypothetical protein